MKPTERARLTSALRDQVAKIAADSLDGMLRSAEMKRRALRDQMVAFQEELDWTAYVAFGLTGADEVLPLDEIEAVASEHRPFAIRLARAAAAGSATNYWFEAMGVRPQPDIPKGYSGAMQIRIERRLALLESDPSLSLIETPEYKRKWEPNNWGEEVGAATLFWLIDRVEVEVRTKSGPISAAHIVAAIQDDARFLASASIYQKRRDVDLNGLVFEILAAESVPSHPFHIYTQSGLTKRTAWEEVWALQRREDVGERMGPISPPPDYSQGSRGKSTDFIRNDHWQLRGKLDVPKERFIAFTEVPGRSGAETLYGWAGWTPVQRLRAILAIDENLEDADVPLADRIGLLDSAWRLLPDVAREDPAAAARLKAELQALVGPKGPSPELIEDWHKRFPPPTARTAGARRLSTKEDVDDSFDDLPTFIPDVSDGEHAALFIWALLYASGGTATRMDLARAFALRARPNLMKRLVPGPLKREAAHWASTVGSRSVKAGLLASTLGALVDRNGVLLGIDGQSRATVSTSTHTPAEDQIDPWFRFEADLAMKVLRAQPEEKFSAIDKSLSGADRKLLENAA